MCMTIITIAARRPLMNPGFAVPTMGGPGHGESSTAARGTGGNPTTSRPSSASGRPRRTTDARSPNARGRCGVRHRTGSEELRPPYVMECYTPLLGQHRILEDKARVPPRAGNGRHEPDRLRRGTRTVSARPSYYAQAMIGVIREMCCCRRHWALIRLSRG